jgi:hypothetical protein
MTRARPAIVLAFVLGCAAGGASCRTAQAASDPMLDRAVRALERIATALEKRP